MVLAQTAREQPAYAPIVPLAVSLQGSFSLVVATHLSVPQAAGIVTVFGGVAYHVRGRRVHREEAQLVCPIGGGSLPTAQFNGMHLAALFDSQTIKTLRAGFSRAERGECS